MIKKIIDVIWFMFCLVFVAVLLRSAYEDYKDSSNTDLIIRIDSKTGCEYLTTKHGGLTPRMNQSGMYQICTTPVRKVN